MEKKAIISARDVEIQFSLRGRTLKAIRKCSLDLYEGETLAIVGESGSGKSVFTKTFVGMLDVNGKITGGSIMYEGRDMTKFTEKDWLGRARQKDLDGDAGPDDQPEPAEKDRQADPGEHRASPGPEGRSRQEGRHRDAGQGRHPRPRAPVRAVPARVLGRYAPARGHRHRGGLQAPGADLRRAHHRPGCDHPGPDFAADP